MQIANALDSYAATLTRRGDQDVFFMTTQGIGQLVQRLVVALFDLLKVLLFLVKTEGLHCWQSNSYCDVFTVLNASL
jgi:hypothetical protein